MTIDQKTSEGFGFALKLYEDDPDSTIDLPLVNHTFIPTSSCNSDESSSGLSSEYLCTYICNFKCLLSHYKNTVSLVPRPHPQERKRVW